MRSSEVLFWGILSFLTGIAFASFGWSMLFLIGIFCVAGIAAIAHGVKAPRGRYFALFGAFAFLGAFYFNAYLNFARYLQHIAFNEEISFSGVISEEPRRFERYQYFDIRLREPYSGKARVISSPTVAFHYGDVIEATGEIERQESPATPPVSPFPKIKKVGEHQGFWLKERLLELKTRFIARIIEFLPTNEGALLAGVTFGDRSHITADFREQMAASGTTHLVALSGYNIAIISLAVSRLFGDLMSRRKNFYFTNLLILAFVAMVGAEPSVVRAALMAFLVLLAREVGRIYDMKNAIAVAGGAMALANPTSLVYDVGFQLSFASLLGIVYLSPSIEALFKVSETASAWKQNAITTLAAQLAVVPIALHNFGYVSILAIAANVLILSFMPLTMFFGFVLAGLASVFRYGGLIIAKIVQPLLAYEVWVIEKFSAISIPVYVRFSLVVSILYYICLAFACTVIKSNVVSKSPKTYGQEK